MRSLTVRYVGEDEVQPRATLTFAEQIPTGVLQKCWLWLQTGEPKVGRAKSKLTVLVMQGQRKKENQKNE